MVGFGVRLLRHGVCQTVKGLNQSLNTPSSAFSALTLAHDMAQVC